MNLALRVATAAFVESPASSCPDIWSFIFRSCIFSAPAELSGSGSGAGRVEKFSPSPPARSFASVSARVQTVVSVKGACDTQMTGFFVTARASRYICTADRVHYTLSRTAVSGVSVRDGINKTYTPRLLIILVARR